MYIDPIVAAVLGAGVGFATGNLLGTYRSHRARAAAGRPEIAVDGRDLVIRNRLEEEIVIVKIAVDRQFALAFRHGADGSAEADHWFRRSRQCNYVIRPAGMARLQLLLEQGEAPAEIVLTFVSSLGTLKRDRFLVFMPAASP